MPNELDPIEFEAYAEFALRAAVSDLRAVGLSATEIHNILDDVLSPKPEREPTPKDEPIPF